jgi:hypothetical protein
VCIECIEYYPLSPIYIAAFTDRRMKKVQVDKPPKNFNSNCFRLTDGLNFVWVHFNADEGRVTQFTCPDDDPDDILTEIAETLDAKIVSKCKSQYWGFETEEEWETFQKAREKKRQDELYDNMVKFIRGESNTLTPNTIETAQAEIAKRLVAKSPSLLHAYRQLDLMKAVETIHGWEAQLRAIEQDEIPF